MDGLNSFNQSCLIWTIHEKLIEERRLKNRAERLASVGFVEPSQRGLKEETA